MSDSFEVFGLTGLDGTVDVGNLQRFDIVGDFLVVFLILGAVDDVAALFGEEILAVFAVLLRIHAVNQGDGVGGAVPGWRPYRSPPF